MNARTDEAVREVPATELGALHAMARADIDQQIATAHAYPRSIKRFIADATDMATINEEIAAGCIYALPRDGKTIEGPSARLAEIAASAWGNCRAGASVIGEDADFVTARGIFHDLEKNVAIAFDVKRRITDRNGRRFKPDMIAVTGNAAASIALRNAVFKGIPKSFWNEVYNATRKVVVGDTKTLANRRADAVAYLQKFGATEAQVLAKLGRAGIQDITGEDLVILRGLVTALKDGDTTVEETFGEGIPGKAARPVYTEAEFKEKLETWRPLVVGNKKTPDEIIGMVDTKVALTDEQKKAIRELAPAQGGAA
jgi:hypothetical protein